MLHEVTIERLQEIEEERAEVYADDSFQTWMKDLKVGILVKKHHDRASEMMSMWTDRHGERNVFNYLIKIK